ncbi:hypothetical protein LW4_028 [Lactococcus phage LW4]|uniref:Uncharacterized protein n=4 Tax=Teubervirus LW31 TaxID=2845420 RepID=A0A1W6JHV1_9CAUD|nr:hypothetical protein H1N70_gp27 [Lactococcus phage LW31]ARM65629.1 hypothetical protein LW31_027 [Lactococcus phage LW31]ARM65714.1 hypothetical protein LW32_027 [Lactococcus phage LW32]ARM65802.1 hypothetical protein LW33_028 [Lactococcus phage LW33]ARM65888.1 hypothetical protein LW4_028 [Lactococcus phage LW4]
MSNTEYLERLKESLKLAQSALEIQDNLRNDLLNEVLKIQNEIAKAQNFIDNVERRIKEEENK